jgi:MoaA/NifB/PqqE/SkfB family radical SAM enzyme
MITLALVVTTACSLKCKHCFRGDAAPRQLSFDLVEKAVAGAKKLGLQLIHVTGGEPFLYDRLGDLFDCAEKNSVLLSF